MAGQVITITSGKGGVGKTTTTANLGVALASHNNKVAVVDADIGLRNLDVVMGLENRIVYDLVDAIEGRCRLRQALIKDKRYPELSLLPAAQTRDKNAVKPQEMAQLCKDLAKDFDYVLIDSPAGIEQGFKNAIAGANRVIIVTNPEISAVRDADRIIGLVEAAEIPTPQLIINRVRTDMVKRGEMMSVDDVLEILAIDLIGVVPEDNAIVISTNRGESVTQEKASRAGQAYLNIARRIEGETVPFLPMDNSDGFMGRIVSFFTGGRSGAKA